MGKTCIAAIGLGLAGAIIGMHIYMFSGSDEMCIRDSLLTRYMIVCYKN